MEYIQSGWLILTVTSVRTMQERDLPSSLIHTELQDRGWWRGGGGLALHFRCTFRPIACFSPPPSALRKPTRMNPLIDFKLDRFSHGITCNTAS
jgi:hypothetical protein